MTAWLLRTGFTRVTLIHHAIVLGWDLDLSGVVSFEDVQARYRTAYPTARPHRVRVRAGQMWSFFAEMQVDDLVLMARDHAVAIARVAGEFAFRPDLPAGARMTRPVEWLATDMASEAIDQTVFTGIDPMLALQPLSWTSVEAQIISALHGSFALRSGRDSSSESFGLAGKKYVTAGDVPATESEVLMFDIGDDKRSGSKLEAMVEDVAWLNGRDSSDDSVARVEEQQDASAISGWPFSDADSDDTARTFIEGYVHDAIRDALWREYPGVQLADLLADLLRIRGYTVDMRDGEIAGRKTLRARGASNDTVVLRIVSDLSPKNPYGSKGTVEDVEAFQAELRASRTDWGELLCWRGWRNRAEAAAELIPTLDLRRGDDVVTAFLACYQSLPEEIRTRIPLKSIWILDESV